MSNNKPPFMGERVRLADVCELIMGQSPSSTSYNMEGDGLPFYQGNSDFGEICPTASIWCTNPKTKAEKGDILISVRAPIGAINIASQECCIGRGLAAIRPKTSNVSSDYLVHMLLANRKKLEGMGTGSTFKAIGKKVLSEYLIPIYGKTKQIKIGQQFTTILKCMKTKQQQLDKLDQLIKSQFVEMFENDPSIGRTRLKDVCSLITDGTHQPPKFQTEGIPFLFVSNIASNELTYETTKYISQEDYETLIARTPIEVGDILVSAVGSFGHPAIVKDEQPFCFQRHIAYLKPMHTKIDSAFLHAALLSDESQRYMDKVAKGAAQRTVTLKSFKELIIPLPPLPLQQKFAAFVAEVDKSRFVVQKQIENLQTLYDSLAQEYFG